MKKDTFITSYKVVVSEIRVGRRSYSFKYRLYKNGKFVKSDESSGSHSRSHTTMRKYLKEGYAAELVLESEI